MVDRRVPGLLYVAYAAGDRGHGEIFLTRSLKGGRSFRRPVHVSTGGRGSDQFFPWVATDPIDGEVTVIWYDRHLPRVNLGLDVFYARSRDGTRFGEVRRLTSANARPGSAALNVGDYIGVVSDGSGSYAAWADGRAGGDWDIYFGFAPK